MKRAASLCPHCHKETYLLQAKAQPSAIQPIGKGVRCDVGTGSWHWNCAGCGAEHILEYEVTFAKSGPPRLMPHLRTLPPLIPTLPLR